ncbi:MULTISPECIES: hypothetical protein [unclassified Acinetobacter]|uniref:hypothetical protein n=1 Tax=unclassified Acinetobacter TaxID=196816 RepID=UPI0035B8129B
MLFVRDTAMQDIIEHYENLDTSDFKVVQPKIIQTLQQRHHDFLASQHILGLDAEVLTWLSHQDSHTKSHINDVIKHIMAVKNTNK